MADLQGNPEWLASSRADRQQAGLPRLRRKRMVGYAAFERAATTVRFRGRPSGARHRAALMRKPCRVGVYRRRWGGSDPSRAGSSRP